MILIGLFNYFVKVKQYVLERGRMILLVGEKWNEDREIFMDIDSNDLEIVLLIFQYFVSFGVLRVDNEKDICVICMDIISDKQVLFKCKYEFCRFCIYKVMLFKLVCFVCQIFYGIQKGNQLEGIMIVVVIRNLFLGYDFCGFIVIDYIMEGGI